MANLTFRAYFCLGELKATHNGYFASFKERIGDRGGLKGGEIDKFAGRLCLLLS